MGIYSRWFTCGFSLRGHRRHIRLFFDTFDFLSRWRLSVNNPSVRGVFRTLSPRGQVYKGNFGGPEPRRRALNVALEISPGDWRWLASVSQSQVCRFSEVSEEPTRRYRSSITFFFEHLLMREKIWRREGESGDKASKGWMSIKIQVNFEAIGSNGCALVRERAASCRATVCSAAGQGANKPNPILCRISSHSLLLSPPSSPLLSLPSLQITSNSHIRATPYNSSYFPAEYPSSKVRLDCLLACLPPSTATHNPPNPSGRRTRLSSESPTPPMEFLHPHHRTPPPHRLVQSTDRSLIDRHPSPLDEHVQCSRFPTSSDRSRWPSSFPPEPVPDSRATRYDPLGSLALDEGALARKALFSSFAPRFFPCSVSRGVLSDGTWTTEHPSVHVFLQSPSSRPSIKSRTSAAIYSLAALHVFYSPSHPSYDAFWHPNIKEGTAMFVHQVISTSSNPFLSCLLGSHLCLFLSLSLQP